MIERKPQSSYHAHVGAKSIGSLGVLGGRGIVVGAAIYSLGVLIGGLVKPPDWATKLLDAKPACSFEIGSSAECGPVIVERPWETEEVRKNLPSWSGERTRLTDQCLQSRSRQCVLLRDLDNESSGAFLEARQRLDEERAAFRALKTRERHLEFSKRDTRSFILLGLVDLVIAIVAVQLLAVTGRPALGNHLSKIAERRFLPALAFIAMGSALAAFTMYLGGVVYKDKLWIGIDSYTVSHWSWGCNLLAMFGVAIMFAQPMALLWSMTDLEFIPAVEEVRPLAPGGDCNVGSYVSFLHTWTILAFSLSLVPAVAFMRWFAEIEEVAFRPYLVAVFGGLALTATLVCRLVLNAIRLRSRYKQALASLGASWHAVKETKPAPDPTIVFIGEDWWKLPATLGSMLIAFWTILEWTGVARTLADSISK